jgi:hypothetical protein
LLRLTVYFNRLGIGHIDQGIVIGMQGDRTSSRLGILPHRPGGNPSERLGQELTVPDHPELTGIALGNQDIAVITEGEIKRIGQAQGQ